MIPLCATGRFRRPIHGPQMPSLFFFFFPQMPSQTNQHCHSHTHPIYASGKANITYTTTLHFLGPQPNFVDCRAKHVTTSSGMWRTSSGRLNSIYGVCLFSFFFGLQQALFLLTQIHWLALWLSYLTSSSPNIKNSVHAHPVLQAMTQLILLWTLYTTTSP